VTPRRGLTVALLLAAMVLAVLAGLGAVGAYTWAHYQALGWWALACLAAAFLPL